MSLKHNKMSFWSVLAIVIGSQVGSGIFMQPATMAVYGEYSFYGWAVAIFIAIALALIFANLCFLYPKTGGPHVYIQNVMGDGMGFFVGWTYWVISWVSSTAVIVAAIGYLTPFFGGQDKSMFLLLEIILLLSITWINLKGVEFAGKCEFVLSVIKFVPLFIVPVIALYYFDYENIQVSAELDGYSNSKLISKTTLLALWGFIGVESATTPAESVDNPTRVIPLAIIVGTVLVALLYVLNSIGIMGLIPAQDLAASQAPYVDATLLLFGGRWHLITAVIASLICIGTLNAWVLTSGQIALGNANDGLFPKVFSKKNKNEAPFIAILTSSLGMVPFLIFTNDVNVTQQLEYIIDLSVLCFLYVYLFCAIAYVKLLLSNSEEKIYSIKFMYSALVIAFLVWVIYTTDNSIIIFSLLFPLSGLPIFLYRRYS